MVAQKYLLLTTNNNLSNTIMTKGDNRNSGISLTKAMISRIDLAKHPDIPRSRFVSRILEAALMQLEENKQTEVMGATLQVTPITQDVEHTNAREYNTSK